MRRIIRKPETDISRVLLATCYGHLGHAQEAQVLWQELLRINPLYSLEHRREVMPYKDPADFQHIVDGMKAKVPA
jgi:adenylate cyclase